MQLFPHTCAYCDKHTSVVSPATLVAAHLTPRDFDHGVSHLMKVTIGETNPDMGLEHNEQQTFGFSPDGFVGAIEMPVLTMSTASDWGRLVKRHPDSNPS